MSAELIETLDWFDSDLLAGRAQDFYEKHMDAIRAVPQSQWEWLRRMGEGAATFEEYWRVLRRDLAKNPEEKDDGKLEWRWKPPELVPALRKEIAEAAKPDNSGRRQALENGFQSEAEPAVRERMRVSQAREFIHALVTIIKTGPQPCKEAVR